MYRRKIFKDTFNSPQKQPSTAAFFHKNTKDAEPVASYVFLSIIKAASLCYTKKGVSKMRLLLAENV